MSFFKSIRISRLRRKLNSHDSSKYDQAIEELSDQNGKWEISFLNELLIDPSENVRIAASRALKLRGWKPSNISDIKILAAINDDSASWLIRHFSFKNIQEGVEAMQTIFKINPGHTVDLLVRVCWSTHGESLKKFAVILEEILKQHPSRVNDDDLKTVATLRDDSFVERYYAGSAFSSSLKMYFPCSNIRSLAEFELKRRGISLS